MTIPKRPEDDCSLVIRTDFSDDILWEQVCQSMQEPQTEYGFRASVECISDTTCSGLTPEKLAFTLQSTTSRPFVFVVDTTTITHPEHPVLVVDLTEGQGRSFRVIPSEAWGVENNLRLANMDFSEFAESVDMDGVFRGFPR